MVKSLSLSLLLLSKSSNNFKKFLLLFILISILLISNCNGQNDAYDSYVDYSDNDGNSNNNDHYNFEKNLAFTNQTFINNSKFNKPTIIYFTYKITPYYKFGYIGMNEIKNGSATHVANGHIPIDDLSIPFEMLMTKSHNTLIVTGVSGAKKDGYNGCRHYFDYGDVRYEDCRMWVNLIDISKNKRLSHYSIYYNSGNSSLPNVPISPNNGILSHIVIGMSYNSDNDSGNTFRIVTTTDYFHIEGSLYSNSNQTLNYYETNIKIEPIELDSFKKSHDKLNNIYYCYIKEAGQDGNHYLIKFNVNLKLIEYIIKYDNPMKLEFMSIGISGWSNRLVIAGCPKSFNHNQTNVYSLSIIDQQQSITSTKLLFIKDHSTTQFVKTENTKYFMFYNKGKSTLTTFNLEKLYENSNELNNDHQDYDDGSASDSILTDDAAAADSTPSSLYEDNKISFKMKVPEYAQIVELYAFYQDPVYIQPTKTDGLTSGKLFIMVFYPIFGLFVLTLITTCIVLTRRKNKKRKLIELQTAELEKEKENIVKPPTTFEDENQKEIDIYEKQKQFLEVQNQVILEFSEKPRDHNCSDSDSDSDS